WFEDPYIRGEMKEPSPWPPPLREELGDDCGATEAGRARQVFRRHFAEARRALDEFKPDVIIMFGDDQYENFKEDIVPPFAVLAYDAHEIEPWKNRAWNPWGEPNDKRFSFGGHRAAGKYLAARLLAHRIHTPYAYKPLHHPLGHAFAYTLLLLDDERRGFGYPVVPFSVNCYGRRVNAARGLRLPLKMRDKIRELDPPSPSPARCMAVGAAAAKG